MIAGDPSPSFEIASETPTVPGANQPDAQQIAGCTARVPGTYEAREWDVAPEARNASMTVDVDWADSANDFDMALCRVEDGDETQVGSSTGVGGSGSSEFAEYINTGKMRALAVTSDTRLKGINVPTLKEQGVNVVIGNWRGVYGAPGISAAERQALTEMILKAVKSKAWMEASEKNNWTPAVLTGAAFDKFVDDDMASLRATMVKSGMV